MKYNTLIQDAKTKDFIKRVKSLLESGEVKNRKEIGDAIPLGKSMFSSVMNGHKNISPANYRKFTEIYQSPPIVNNDTQAAIPDKAENLDAITQPDEITQANLQRILDDHHAMIHAHSQSVENESRALALANKLADGNLEMFRKLEPTVETVKEFQLAEHSKLSVVQDLLVQIGVKVGMWPDPKAGIYKIDNLFAEQMNLIKKKGNRRSGVGKRSK